MSTPIVILNFDTVMPRPSAFEDPRHLGIFFDKEMDRAAEAVIIACQSVHAWGPCSAKAIADAYSHLGYTGLNLLTLDGLVVSKQVCTAWDKMIDIGGGYLIPTDDGRYCITTAFVNACRDALLRRKAKH